MLNFIGIGSAFNTKRGNTSAFIKHNQGLLLIDCGGTVFSKLNDLQLLSNLKKLHIIVTHTHPDHIGSLGDVIFYAHYILKIKPTLYHPNARKLKKLLKLMGVKLSMVKFEQHMITTIKKGMTPLKLSFVPVVHSTTVKAYGLTLEGSDDAIYYSGDANHIPTAILDSFKEKRIMRLYQDTSGQDVQNSSHLSLKKLTELITREERNRVYCMHIDQELNTNELKELGFKIPTLFKS